MATGLDGFLSALFRVILTRLQKDGLFLEFLSDTLEDSCASRDSAWTRRVLRKCPPCVASSSSISMMPANTSPPPGTASLW